MIHLSTLKINSEILINWMNVIRLNQDNNAQQYRILESFWESQIKSKSWLINVMKEISNHTIENVFIFGGWYGVLGTLLYEYFPSDIYSIDMDPDCKKIGEMLNPKVNFLVSSMENFTYNVSPSLVINTSTEHITQEIYNQWYRKIPSYTLVVLQGNNFYDCQEHVRCSSSLQDFKRMNPLSRYLYEGELDCTQFTRYMTIGYKE